MYLLAAEPVTLADALLNLAIIGGGVGLLIGWFARSGRRR